MFTSKKAIFLGISEQENRVLQSIGDEAKNIFVLSKDTSIPRATLYLIIQKLFHRGFITVKRDGKRFLYQTVSTEKLKNTLLDLVDELS